MDGDKSVIYWPLVRPSLAGQVCTLPNQVQRAEKPVKSSQLNVLLRVKAPGLRDRTGWGGEKCLVSGLSFAGKPRSPIDDRWYTNRVIQNPKHVYLVDVELYGKFQMVHTSKMWMWNFMGTHPKQHLQCVSEMWSPVKICRRGVHSNCV